MHPPKEAGFYTPPEIVDVHAHAEKTLPGHILTGPIAIEGAKPGHGGILPKHKITEEIAQIRGVSRDQDCISPPKHSAFNTPIEMMHFILMQLIDRFHEYLLYTVPCLFLIFQVFHANTE